MDTIQNYKCPCCTASLVFDANSQNLICESCDNIFTLETIQQMTDGNEASSGTSKFDWESYTPRSYEDTNEITLSNYSCPSCGAEISGDDTLGSTVCPYCGNSTIVKGQFDGTLKPDYIIPFKLNKKTAVEAFENDFKNAPFLPDEFKNKRKIKEMAGVYVPFWMFDCDCDAAVSYNAERITAWMMKRKLKKMKTAVENDYAANYIKPGSMRIDTSRDLFLYSTIIKTEKPKSSSGTHTSSSGRTHGGSGGSF